MAEPPPFQEATRCDVCKCSFNAFRRRATVFNFTEIAFILMDAGASVDAKNAQGETPLDCAQTMLQYKMRQKMQETANI